MKLLHVDSSILGAHSVSRQLTAEVVAEWKKANPSTTVDYLDVAAHAPAHFGADALGIKVGVQAEPTPAQRAENALSEQLISQFLAADVIVVGAPLYNFTIPSQLKAWIDRVLVAGQTFRYTESGVEGLAKGKKVIVASTRGGHYSVGSPAAGMDHQETYLQTVLGFIGVTDIEFVRAEGLAISPDSKEAAIKEAQAAIAGRRHFDIAA